MSAYMKQLFQGVVERMTFAVHSLLHRSRSVVIAAPGFLGYEGGIFNPGAVETSKDETVLLAKGQLCHWTEATSDERKFKLYLKGDPVMIRLDRAMRIVSSNAIRSRVGFPADDTLAIEDFRLFTFKSGIWVNHALIPVITGNNRVGYNECSQALSLLDQNAMTLTYIGQPTLDVTLNRKEKNWVYRELDNELYLFYSLDPYRVLKLVDAGTLEFRTVVHEQFGPRLGDVGGFGTMVSFSTNPVEYDDRHLLSVIHQVDKRNSGRIYYHWGLLTAKDDLTPTMITSRPIISGLGARGKLKGICYVMSAIPGSTDITFYCGEGDSHVTRMAIPRTRLDKLWTSL